MSVACTRVLLVENSQALSELSKVKIIALCHILQGNMTLKHLFCYYIAGLNSYYQIRIQIHKCYQY